MEMHDATTGDVRSALERLQSAEGGEAQASAMEDYMRAIDDRQRRRGQVVAGVIAACGRELSRFELHAITWEWVLFIDRLENMEGVEVLDEAAVLLTLRHYVGHLVEDPLRLKMLVAYEMEGHLNNDAPVANGILGRAVDEVIAQLTPYVENDKAWK